MSRAIAVTCALLLGGCSLVWGVDADRFRDAGADAQIEDAGPDADRDAGPDDAGDAGDAGMQCPARFERLCEDGEDDDCDGLVDCNDFDCATQLSCCGTSSPLFPVESFTTFPAAWTWMPIAEGAIAQPPGSLSDFGNSGHVRAVRVDECIPIDLGVRITAQLAYTGASPVCADGTEDCENYAAIVITESRDLIPPASLSDNLSVRLDHEGHAQIRAAAGDVVLDSADDGVTFGATPISVVVDLTPGTDDDGVAYVFATVTLAQAGMDPWPGDRFTLRAAFPRQYLLGESYGCVDARGLLLAFEGYGPNVSIDRVGVSRYGCANPSHFEPVRAIGASLDAEDLDSDIHDSSDWTGGGLGSPAIQSFFEGADERTELLYDASNRDRTLEGRDDVHYSIGGSATSDPDALSGYAPHTMGGPMIGLRPPDCLGKIGPPGGCDVLQSMREPTLFVPVDASRTRISGATIPLLFARETGFSTGVFEIAGAVAGIGDAAPLVVTPPVAAPAGGCISMRDPVVVPTRPGSDADPVVLYTCERSGQPSSIRALRLIELAPSPTIEHIAGEVIDPASLGAIAVAGVRAPDAAVWFHDHGTPDPLDDELVMRVWFVTEDLGRDPATISFAEGGGPLGELPTLHPYAANPVLRSRDPLLGDCPTAGCTIESLAVTRLANSPNTVRLMISRTPEPTTGIEHVLVPLDQVWPPLQ